MPRSSRDRKYRSYSRSHSRSVSHKKHYYTSESDSSRDSYKKHKKSAYNSKSRKTDRNKKRYSSSSSSSQSSASTPRRRKRSTSSSSSSSSSSSTSATSLSKKPKEKSPIEPEFAIKDTLYKDEEKRQSEILKIEADEFVPESFVSNNQSAEQVLKVEVKSEEATDCLIHELVSILQRFLSSFEFRVCLIHHLDIT